MGLAPLFVFLGLAAACRASTPSPPILGAVPPRRVLVDLKEQVDLAGFQPILNGTRRQRGEQVIAALDELAKKSQAGLIQFLEAEQREGRVRSWQRFSIVNRLLVEASPAGLEALARRSEVAAVIPEIELPMPALMKFAAPHLNSLQIQPSPSPGKGTSRKMSWAVEAVGAPAAWSRGLKGSGVVLGVIDSGASSSHEQLDAGFRGGETSWLDPAGGSTEPRDTRFGHGTGVLSVAVGRNASGITLGIAPDARWIACAALPEGRYNNVLATQCADWMLNVGRPDVLVVAWVLPQPGCDRSLEWIVAAWRAAGILPVFAAGNYGPQERTDRSPANYSDVVSVGGLSRDKNRYGQTSRGPSACDGASFPRITAPAEDLIAAFPLGRTTYLTAKGTSFAAGIAGGAAAILIQEDPAALVPDLEEALTMGAKAGRLDLPGALARLDRIRKRATAR